MKNNLKKAQDKLAELTSDLNTDLEAFIDMGNTIGVKIDFSVESLDKVENILRYFEGKKGFDYIKNDAWLYIGEVVCHNYNAHWEISNDNKNYRNNYLMPIVTGHTLYADQYNPMALIEDFLREKKSGFLKQELLKQINLGSS